MVVVVAQQCEDAQCHRAAHLQRTKRSIYVSSTTRTNSVWRRKGRKEGREGGRKEREGGRKERKGERERREGWREEGGDNRLMISRKMTDRRTGR